MNNDKRSSAGKARLLRIKLLLGLKKLISNTRVKKYQLKKRMTLGAKKAFGVFALQIKKVVLYSGVIKYLIKKFVVKIFKGLKRFVEYKREGTTFWGILKKFPTGVGAIISLAKKELQRSRKQASGHVARDEKAAIKEAKQAAKEFSAQEMLNSFNSAVDKEDYVVASVYLLRIEREHPDLLLDSKSIELVRKEIANANILTGYLQELKDNVMYGKQINWENINLRNKKSLDAKFSQARPKPKTPWRLLIVGHKHTSFIFLLPIIERLKCIPELELRTLDASVLITPPVPDREGVFPSYAQELIQWADVVFVEWATDISCWFVDQIPVSKKVVLRLHSYELLRKWPLLFDWGKIDKLICVSKPNLMRLTEVLDPETFGCKTHVLPNLFETNIYTKPKVGDVSKSLGLVGYGSQNKRPDLALDLLEMLLKHDESWRLHLIGSPPEVETEKEFFEEFFQRANTLSHQGKVTFTPWSDDLSTWLQNIGVILSCSDREGTHESCREGIASGCLGMIRNWPWVKKYGGNEELFPNSFRWESVSEAAEYLASLSSSQQFKERAEFEQNSFLEQERPDVLIEKFLEIVRP